MDIDVDNISLMAMDRWKLVKHFLKTRGIYREHINSFNQFINKEIQNIVYVNRIVKIESNPQWFMKYKNVRIGKPNQSAGIIGKDCNIYPHECRIRDLTYSAPILVDTKYVRGKELVIRDNVEIGRLPIMLRSDACHLANLDENELTKLNECPLDPGGYFIINGIERVMLLQEQMISNRMMLEQDKDYNYMCSVISLTSEIKTKCYVVMKKHKIYFRHNTLSEDIPVIIILKGMGIDKDLYYESFMPRDTEIILELTSSISHCISLSVITKEDAIEYIGKRIRCKKIKNVNELCLDFLTRIVLPHIPVVDNDFSVKGTYLLLMIRSLILAFLKKIPLDDRDYYGNKRIDTPGTIIGLLFEDLFKKFNSEVQKWAERYHRAPTTSRLDFIDNVKSQNIITGGLNYVLGTGNLKIGRVNLHRIGATQVLSRLSYISVLGMLTRINSLFEKTRKVSGPRSLQPSQWGVICPSDTPEGESCGLVKNLTLLSHISIHNDFTDLLNKLISGLYIEINITPLNYSNYGNMFPVLINGRLVGFCNEYRKLVNYIRSLRRQNSISPFISVYYNVHYKTVIISSDGGRLCRPHIIVKDEQSLLTIEHIKQLEDGVIDFDDLLKMGIVEFLDVNELFQSYIALELKDIKKSTTHLEIASFTIYGICSGIIPNPNHNQSPRITYSCAMGKQAMSVIGYNQHKRIDNVMNSLVYPQAPLCKTKVGDMINYSKLPAGHNAIIAIMSFSGYDIEDAIILNKRSIDFGFMRCQVHKRFNVPLKEYTCQRGKTLVNTFDKTINPLYTDVGNKIKRDPIKYKGLDKDGIICVGERVKRNSILVYKITPTNIVSESTIKINDGEYKEDILSYREPITGIVANVAYVNNLRENFYKVLVCQTRNPEIGDKFASRHAQKGVCGQICPAEDMPHTEDGVIPDIIINPHGIPARMTVGQLIETLQSKVGVIIGKFEDSTAFLKPSIENLMNILQENGYNANGKELLICGQTGRIIPSYIFVGPCYYLKLKHMVADKIHARTVGYKVPLTRQPVEGRHQGGGLRLGEMERDCLIGYGASSLLIERLMLSSDVYEIEICQRCGVFASKSVCPFCKNKTTGKLQIPYAFKLLIQELISMNILPRLYVNKKNNL